jgi:hypothetical protein
MSASIMSKKNQSEVASAEVSREKWRLLPSDSPGGGHHTWKRVM